MSKSISRRTFMGKSAVAVLGISAGCTFTPRFDIIIKNGLVFDGSGGMPVQKDIGINGSAITAIDDLKNARARQIIDAANMAVSPGFIDIHTHTDLELLVNSKGESKVRQGVTTEIGGNCGSSPFPLNDADFEEYRKNVMDRYGIEVAWRDLEGFFNTLEKNGTSINFATLTGHGDLRSYVVGKNDVDPAKKQMQAMQSLLRESMDQGSFGLSTGLEYAPGSYAKTEELVELCRVVSEKNGLYATHMRSEDDFVEEAVDEALTISRESGAMLQISHLKACNPANWHKTDLILEKISKALDEGMPVMADRYPYIAYGTGLSVFLPLWSRQGTTDDILARLQSKKDLAEIKSYTERRGTRIGGWKKVVISSCFTEENKALEGMSIADAAEMKNVDPFRFITGLLVEERNRVGIVGFAMDEGNLQKVLSAPFVMVGSDGNAVAPYGKLGSGKPHPRFYGTFPRVLGKYARKEHIFDLATAVQKMSSMPAKQLGLKKRGRIAIDNFADIVIFDPAVVIDKATFTDPHQYPEGISHVLVNGVLTIDQGKHTGQAGGAVLRKGQA